MERRKKEARRRWCSRSGPKKKPKTGLRARSSSFSSSSFSFRLSRLCRHSRRGLLQSGAYGLGRRREDVGGGLVGPAGQEQDPLGGELEDGSSSRGRGLCRRRRSRRRRFRGRRSPPRSQHPHLRLLLGQEEAHVPELLHSSGSRPPGAQGRELSAAGSRGRRRR